MQSATATRLEYKKFQGSAFSKVVFEGNLTFSQSKRRIFCNHKELKYDGSVSRTNWQKVDRVAVSAQKYLIALARKSLSVLLTLTHADRKRGDHSL
jgi:hypothetical protein